MVWAFILQLPGSGKYVSYETPSYMAATLKVILNSKPDKKIKAFHFSTSTDCRHIFFRFLFFTPNIYYQEVFPFDHKTLKWTNFFSAHIRGKSYTWCLISCYSLISTNVYLWGILFYETGFHITWKKNYHFFIRRFMGHRILLRGEIRRSQLSNSISFFLFFWEFIHDCWERSFCAEIGVGIINIFEQIRTRKKIHKFLSIRILFQWGNNIILFLWNLLT